MSETEGMTEVDRLLAKFDHDWPDTRADIQKTIRRATADALRAMAERIEGDA